MRGAGWSALLLALGCEGPANPTTGGETCGGFTDWQTSAYVLPYAVGEAFLVEQGNCSAPGNGHRGAARYGYDFTMPVGTAFAAVRDGVVLHVEESHRDGEIAATGLDNVIVVRHADGTAALYGHLTHDGARVAEGGSVAAGTWIGSSGNTGNTGGRPHLHVSVHSCDPVLGGTEGCPSVPVNFRNTSPNPQGLQVGQAYRAE